MFVLVRSTSYSQIKPSRSATYKLPFGPNCRDVGCFGEALFNLVVRKSGVVSPPGVGEGVGVPGFSGVGSGCGAN